MITPNMSEDPNTNKEEDNSQKTFSIAKVVTSSVLLVLLVAGLLITSFVKLQGFDLKVAGLKFWTDKVLLAVATFLLTICVANIVEEAQKKGDTEFMEKLAKLKENFSRICSLGLAIDLKYFIELKNREEKYKTYIRKNKILLSLCFTKKQKIKIYKKLIRTPEEVWEDPKADHYIKMTYGQLISGASEVPKKDNSNDLSVHKGKLALKKAAGKLLMIVIAGGFVGDLIYSFNALNPGMVVPLIFKVISILTAVYMGILFGFIIVNRTKEVMKKKLTIYSEFNAFYQDDGNLIEGKPLQVNITIDRDIEKYKKLLEHLENPNQVEQTT